MTNKQYERLCELEEKAWGNFKKFADFYPEDHLDSKDAKEYSKLKGA